MMPPPMEWPVWAGAFISAIILFFIFVPNFVLYPIKLRVLQWWAKIWFKPLKAGPYNPLDHIIPFIGPQTGYLKDEKGNWFGCVCTTNGSPGWAPDADRYYEDINLLLRMAKLHWKRTGLKSKYIPWPGLEHEGRVTRNSAE